MGSYILSGGTIVEKIFKKIAPKACVGVACLNELFLGSFIIEKFNVASQAVRLKRDGCVNSDVDLNKVMDTVRLKYIST